MQSFNIDIDERMLYNGSLPWNANGRIIEWLDGPELCTYMGKHHLAWSIPLAPVSYYLPSMSVHALLMFFPFFIIDHGSFMKNIGIRIAGVLLFLTGPIIGDYVTDNKHESASIWCFFSILQVIMLVFILIFQKMTRGGGWASGKTTKTTKKSKKS